MGIFARMNLISFLSFYVFLCYKLHRDKPCLRIYAKRDAQCNLSPDNFSFQSGTWRRNDVLLTSMRLIESHRRQCDVIMTPCAWWDFCCFWSRVVPIRAYGKVTFQLTAIKYDSTTHAQSMVNICNKTGFCNKSGFRPEQCLGGYCANGEKSIQKSFS